MGFEHQSELSKHSSQTDASKGFGVQSDRKDKSAAGFEHNEEVAKHPSQTGFGVKKDSQEGSAKASNLRARFENLAKNKEEEDRNRALQERKQRKAQEEAERAKN